MSTPRLQLNLQDLRRWCVYMKACNPHPAVKQLDSAGGRAVPWRLRLLWHCAHGELLRLGAACCGRKRPRFAVLCEEAEAGGGVEG